MLNYKEYVNQCIVDKQEPLSIYEWFNHKVKDTLSIKTYLEHSSLMNWEKRENTKNKLERYFERSEELIDFASEYITKKEMEK